MLYTGMDFLGSRDKFWILALLRFKGPPDGKADKPPELPPAAATPTEIISAAGKAGEAEGRRLRRRTGRRATRITRPELASVPATVSRQGLQTTLG